MIAAFRGVLGSDGLPGLFRSYPVTVSMTVPNGVAYWTTYEAMAVALRTTTRNKSVVRSWCCV